MSGLQDKISTLQQIGEPVYTHGEGVYSGATYYGGRGTGNSLANWVGCDYRTIWGQINTLYVRYYLPDNNQTWGPVDLRISSSDNLNTNTYLLTVYRMKRK